jgi:hypothetical protein
VVQTHRIVAAGLRCDQTATALTTGSDRALSVLSDDVRFKNELTPLRPKNGAADGSG